VAGSRAEFWSFVKDRWVEACFQADVACSCLSVTASATVTLQDKMAHLRSHDLQARPFRAARPRPAHVRAPVAPRSVQRRTVQVQAFFNFLAPKSAAAAANPKAKELSETLLEIATQTKPGAPVSPVTKAEIEELVGQGVLV